MRYMGALRKTGDGVVGEIRKEMERLADPGKAVVLSEVFQDGGWRVWGRDRFLGIVVPKLRRLASGYSRISEDVIGELLESQFHEERLFALLCLVTNYANADDAVRDRIYEMYLARTQRINNWDLVDLSAPNIVGKHLEARPRDVLYRLAGSESLWERRIAIIATLHFIRLNDLADTIEISRLLLSDKEELIHKAAGWMLREAGKRDTGVLEAFLKKHASTMPRTMLRYAIEKLSPDERKSWMSRKRNVAK